MSFKGYTCWNDSTVAETIIVDAARTTDAALLATHHPVTVFKRAIEAGDGGEPYDEAGLLKELLGSKVDPLIMPITGPSGSGKSHIVRWLGAALNDNSVSRHVVYIPKYQTSLRGVIEEIIQGFEGPDFETVSKSLTEAGSNLNEKTAPVELLNRLAASFEVWEPNADIDGTEGLAAKHHLAGSGKFSSLLYDPVFRDPLLKPGGVIDRFVRQAVHGKDEFDEGEPFQFSVDDLPTQVVRIADAGKGAKDIFRDLIGSDQLQETAAATLTDFLQPAIRDLIGIKSHQLSDIFRRVRELLARQGKELVLLIEDFTILQGLQRELLDALLVPTDQAGVSKFARMRTVLAVTDGYFRPLLLDTVRTRVRYRFAIDVKLTDFSSDDQSSFVGRYLNAARVGRTKIEKAWSSAEEEGDQKWVPNACAQCPHEEQCQKAFGTTREGYGLYPFNGPALERCIQSKLSKGAEAQFDPREVLKEVVEYTLDKHHSNIKSGSFPNAAFHKQFRDPSAGSLPTSVEADIDKADPVNAERRKILLVYWGNAPDKITNVAKPIHEAFDLPLLKAVPTGDSTTTKKPKREPVVVEPKEQELEGLQEDLQELSSWREGDELPQKLARRLRSLVHASVVAHMGNWEELVAFPRNWLARGKAFTTDRIEFEQNDKKLPGSIYLFVDRRVLDDVRAIEALLFFDHHGHWKFERGAEHARLLRHRLDLWSEAVARQLHDLVDDEPIEEVTEALFIGSAALGSKEVAIHNPVTCLEAILSNSQQEVVKESPPTAWSRLVAACLDGGLKGDSRSELIERFKAHLGTSKGGSGPQALDPLAVRKAVAAGYQRFQNSALPTDSERVGQHLSKVLKLLSPAMEERSNYVQVWYEEVKDLWGAGTEDIDALVDSTLQAVAEAMRAMTVDPANAYQVLEGLAERFKTAAPKSVIDDMADFVESADDWTMPQKLSFLAQLNLDRLEGIRGFLKMADGILNDIERRLDLEGGDGATGESVHEEASSLADEFRTVADELKQIATIGDQDS